MININTIPQKETPLNYVSNIVLENESLTNKFCIVVPTERNLRIIANKQLKYSDVYKIENLFSIITKKEDRILPVELRPFYLRRAFKQLNQDQRLHIFKKNNSTFLDNFSAFIKSSDTIFKFFRELFAEKISLDDLIKSSKYTDYENQITTLYILWEKYLDIIHKENFYDEWEQYININLIEDFINEYDHYVFIISGFLTKYELEIISKISDLKNVTIYFNYSGKKQKQYMEYEKYFLKNKNSNTVLEDQPIYEYNENNLEIYKCNSWISQYELITRKALEFNQKHNIDLTEMAVIMPNDDMKTYFISLDKYGLYDVTMGNSVTGLKFYNILSRASEFNEFLNFNNINSEILKSNDTLDRIIKIQDVIDLYSSSMILREKDEEYINETIKYLVKKNIIQNENNSDYSDDEQVFIDYITEEYIDRDKTFNKKELDTISPNFDLNESKNKLNLKDYEADYNTPIPKNLKTFNNLKIKFSDKKLYMKLKEALTLPIFNNEIKKILLANAYIKPSEAIKIYKNSLEKLFDHFYDEKPEIDDAITLLTRLEKIYSFIDDEITFMEASNIVLNEISMLFRKQEKRNLIEVSSLLESRNMQYKILFVPGMIESNFPASSLKDMYINTEIRLELGLPTYLDRENLTKNYLYKVMELSDKTIITYPITNDESRASGFIEELKINNNITIKNYEPAILDIFKSKEPQSNNDKNDILVVLKNDKILDEIKNLTFSNNSIKTYLNCSLKFYLKYIKNLNSDYEPYEEINENIIGNVLHNSIQDINDSNKISKEDFLSRLEENFIKHLKEYDAFIYSKKSAFIASNIMKSFNDIVINEQDDKSTTIYREENINVKFKDYKLTGKIDKIREYIENDIKKYDIVDYKYKNNKDIYREIKLKKYDPDKQTDIDIQLPFYALLISLKLEEDKNYFSTTNVNTKFEKAGYFSLKDEFTYNDNFSNEQLGDFKIILKDILEEITSKDVPFTATTKANKCIYCDYNEICRRI